MKSYKVFKMEFNGPLHLYSGGFEEESSDIMIHSDSLFSALCWNANLLYGDAVVQKFLADGALKISSAFPFYAEELFFPKPFDFPQPEFREYSDLKAFKKIRFIGNGWLEKYLKNSLEKYEFKTDLIKSDCLFDADSKVNNPTKLFEAFEIPRVTIDRITNSSEIFHFSQVCFEKNAGLFFITEMNPEIEKEFLASLRLLGDEGIGADKTTGKGLFKLDEKYSLNFDLADDSLDYLLLSLYNPTDQEVNNLNIHSSFYDLATRRGWVYRTGLRRKALRMFTEGSVISFKNKIVPIGRYAKVLDQISFPDELMHDVMRSGKAFALPIMRNPDGSN